MLKLFSMNGLAVLDVGRKLDDERVCGARLDKRGRGSLLFYYSLDVCLHKLKVWKERKFGC